VAGRGVGGVRGGGRGNGFRGRGGLPIWGRRRADRFGLRGGRSGRGLVGDQDDLADLDFISSLDANLLHDAGDTRRDVDRCFVGLEFQD
jgi:hypothetical protein